MIPDLSLHVYNHPRLDLVAVTVEWRSKGEHQHLRSTITKSDFQDVALSVISRLIQEVVAFEKEKNEE